MEDTTKRKKETDGGENRLKTRVKGNGEWKIRENDKRGREEIDTR